MEAVHSSQFEMQLGTVKYNEKNRRELCIDTGQDAEHDIDGIGRLGWVGGHGVWCGVLGGGCWGMWG